jgi:hypothetical protein
MLHYGTVLGITLLIIGFLLSLQGLWLLCRALFPRRVERATERCRKNAIASFFVGLPVTAVWLLIAGAIARRAGTPGQMIGWLLVTFFVLYAGTGMSGFVTFIGQRLTSPADAIRPWRATLRGGVVLEFAFLLPLIGGFVLLPATIILGAGATTLAFFGPATPRDLHQTLAANRDANGHRFAGDVRDLPTLEPQEAI